MSKRQFKLQASSSRAVSGAGFGGFGSSSTGSTLSYLSEPPNLSNISEKDGTTKAKALEDLRTHIQAHPYEQGGPEEPILEAWVRFHAKLLESSSNKVTGQILPSFVHRQFSPSP
jgi:hypothetical protein